MDCNNLQKEAQHCVSSVVIMGPEPNDKPSLSVDKPVDDDFPTDQT